MVSFRNVSREITANLIEFLFIAKNTGRSKVTTIHKANIMKLSDGLFLETSRRVSKDYPEIKHSDMIIDNCCMQLVSNPHQFEVMNMTNLYGTITSNVVCGLIGGAGLLSGKNYGDQVRQVIPNENSDSITLFFIAFSTPSSNQVLVTPEQQSLVRILPIQLQ